MSEPNDPAAAYVAAQMNGDGKPDRFNLYFAIGTHVLVAFMGFLVGGGIYRQLTPKAVPPPAVGVLAFGVWAFDGCTYLVVQGPGPQFQLLHAGSCQNPLHRAVVTNAPIEKANEKLRTALPTTGD